MAALVKLKRSSVASKIPATADLDLGEVALNTHDGNLFFKKSPGGVDAIVQVATVDGTQTLANKTLVAPALGTPASGVATNLTGTAAGLTSGNTTALKSATSTVSVSAAAAPSAGQVLTATSSSSAAWVTNAAGGDLDYTHDQAVPDSVWTIDHNLGKYPSVFVVDSGHTVVIGDIVYINTNSLTASFNSSFAGKAFIN